jgi:hypothetical protein
MSYKIGTRVRCSDSATFRKDWIGITGVVVSGEVTLPDKNMLVRVDRAATSLDGGIKYPAGTIFQCHSKNWTPIIPEGHRAGEKGACESLDKLLEGVSA